MRDLFQVVFELKKKEIELARQHIQSKSIQDRQPVTINIKNTLDSSHSTYNKEHSEPSATSKYAHKEVYIRNRNKIYVYESFDYFLSFTI